MRFTLLVKFTALIIGFLLSLTACSVFRGEAVEATATPLPTSSISNMQVIPSKACLVTKQGMIRVENPQGDLIAWSPVDGTVAYIASTPGSSWNVGELNIVSAPQFDTPTRLASQVAGELTWAPDASSIGYLGLRRSDNIYTVGLAYPGGRAARDLFPDEAARTDDYSSQKSILGWMNSGVLRVFISCGINCLQEVDIGVLSGLSSQVGAPVESPWDLYTPHTHHPPEIPPNFAKLSGQLNWSWDDLQIAYIDERGSAWVISVDSETLYPLDIGQYGTATETDWSYDNQYLALLVDQNLMIFSFRCP